MTIAAAFFMIGTQSGSVVCVTSTAPSTKRSICFGLSMMQTLPATTASPMLKPLTSFRPFDLMR